MTELNRKVIAEDWAKRGYSCSMRTDVPGQQWENFIHATDEIVVVLEGSMEIEVEGEVHRPSVGGEVLIPAGSLHSVRNIGTTETRWLYGYKGV